MTIEVRTARASLPDDLTGLAGAADGEGIRIVSVVIERWRDGSQRYDQPG